MIADMIADETRTYPAASVDPSWADQVGGLRATSYGPATYGAELVGERRRLPDRVEGAGHRPTFWAAVATAIEAMHLFSHCRPWSGSCRSRERPVRAGAGKPASAPAGDGTASAADDRMLGRIRALLAKAESTEFAEEAEALSARAQELMAKYSIDHALLAAQAGEREEPSGRRIPVDGPYEEPKATLLNVIALANRCRAVWSKDVGLMTVVGFPADLDAVELLFTSLLVQANTAMLRPAGRRTSSAGPHAGVPSVVPRLVRDPDRRATGRGDRPRHAEAVAEPRPRRRRAGRRRDGVGEFGHRPGAVPRRTAPAVDDAVDELFGGNLKRRSARATDAEGWTSGRAAADLASLRNQAQVAG